MRGRGRRKRCPRTTNDQCWVTVGEEDSETAFLCRSGRTERGKWFHPTGCTLTGGAVPLENKQKKTKNEKRPTGGMLKTTPKREKREIENRGLGGRDEGGHHKETKGHTWRWNTRKQNPTVKHAGGPRNRTTRTSRKNETAHKKRSKTREGTAARDPLTNAKKQGVKDHPKSRVLCRKKLAQRGRKVKAPPTRARVG